MITMQTEKANEGQIDPLFRDILATHKMPGFVATGTFVGYSDEEIEALRRQEPLPPNQAGFLPAEEQEE